MAVYCPKQKLIYFAIPQTGSKATALTLREKLGGEDMPAKRGLFNGVAIGKHHSTMRQLVRGGLLSKEEMAALYKVGGSRNPWDLMVSRYYKHKERFTSAAEAEDDDENSKYKWASKNDRVAQSMQAAQEGNFPKWLNLLIVDLRGGKVPSFDGLDFIIRMEHLQADFDKVMAHCGVKEQVIVGEYNVTKERLAEGEADKPAASDAPPPPRVKRDYTALYDDASRQLVAETYKDWIDRFGYKFGEKLPL